MTENVRIRHRASSRTRPAHRLRPEMEGLEDRKLLYSTLGGFAYGSRITYSFVPDGTNIGGTPSSLFQTMSNRGFSVSAWQAAFQKAAATWEAVANVNLVQVSDDGSSYGTAGDQQGDSRFGDIRIGGTPLSSSVLATCFLPPPSNGGTLAGDVVFNTTQAWQINTDYDLQTVAIHELGHALGLGHSVYTTADMFGVYNGMKQGLTSDDIAGVQAVYGPRQPDANDATLMGNNSYLTATPVSLDTLGQASLPGMDITTSTDCDWYTVTAPANASGTLTVTMQSSNLSSLSPKVMLYSGSLVGLAQASAAYAFGSTVTVSISGVTSGQRYFIKAVAANGGPTGAGAYGLTINFGSGTMPAIAPPNTTVASQPDAGGGSANDSTDKPVHVGTLTAQGDNLSIDANLKQAIDLVNNGWDPKAVYASPIEALTIRALVQVGQNTSSQTADGRAARQAIIQAIDVILNTWNS